jgi:hypothetical protein
MSLPHGREAVRRSFRPGLPLVVQPGRDRRARAGACSVTRATAPGACCPARVTQSASTFATSEPAAASHPRSCQGATPGRPVAAARWATTRRSRDWRTARPRLSAGSRPASLTARVPPPGGCGRPRTAADLAKPAPVRLSQGVAVPWRAVHHSEGTIRRASSSVPRSSSSASWAIATTLSAGQSSSNWCSSS